MQNVKLSVFDLAEANYAVVSTLEEAVALTAGGEVGVINRLNNQVLYHQVYGDVRSALVDRVEKEGLTTNAEGVQVKGFKMKSHVEKDSKGKDVTVIDEKPEPFIRRAIAEGAVTKEQLAVWQQEICDHPEYAYSEYLKSERRHAAPKKLSKDIELAVAAAIANGTASAVADKLSGLLGRQVDGTNPQELGEAIRDHRRALLEKANAEAKAALGI